MIGEIDKLECQPRYPITVAGVTCGVYVGDFRYIENGELVVVDVKGGAGGKGTMTPLARLKIKLVKALYGIDVRIVST
jgi:hypothetical protein